MNTLHLSQVMDRLGASVMTVILLAGLPIGVVTALAQSF